jgi:hypothetical protein
VLCVFYEYTSEEVKKFVLRDLAVSVFVLRLDEIAHFLLVYRPVLLHLVEGIVYEGYHFPDLEVPTVVRVVRSEYLAYRLTQVFVIFLMGLLQRVHPYYYTLDYDLAIVLCWENTDASHIKHHS